MLCFWLILFLKVSFRFFTFSLMRFCLHREFSFMKFLSFSQFTALFRRGSDLHYSRLLITNLCSFTRALSSAVITFFIRPRMKGDPFICFLTKALHKINCYISRIEYFWNWNPQEAHSGFISHLMSIFSLLISFTFIDSFLISYHLTKRKLHP